MSWVAVGLALGFAALAFKHMRTKSALTKNTMLLSIERKKTARLVKDHKDLQGRADERIKQLKRRVNALLEQNIENSKPGDMLDALNSLNKLHEDS